eukprot:COSAG05_NODE_3559_length_1990_cov_2.333157_3_plen_80_part_00
MNKCGQALLLTLEQLATERNESVNQLTTLIDISMRGSLVLRRKSQIEQLESQLKKLQVRFSCSVVAGIIKFGINTSTVL